MLAFFSANTANATDSDSESDCVLSKIWLGCLLPFATELFHSTIHRDLGFLFFIPPI